MLSSCPQDDSIDKEDASIDMEDDSIDMEDDHKMTVSIWEMTVSIRDILSLCLRQPTLWAQMATVRATTPELSDWMPSCSGAS
jgi:hypothetical protein